MRQTSGVAGLSCSQRHSVYKSPAWPTHPLTTCCFNPFIKYATALWQILIVNLIGLRGSWEIGGPRLRVCLGCFQTRLNHKQVELITGLTL